MGDRDWVKPLLEAKGTIHFGRVLMKPGKPLTFATLELPQGRQMLVFGLPGRFFFPEGRLCLCACHCFTLPPSSDLVLQGLHSASHIHSHRLQINTADRR